MAIKGSSKGAAAQSEHAFFCLIWSLQIVLVNELEDVSFLLSQ